MVQGLSLAKALNLLPIVNTRSETLEKIALLLQHGKGGFYLAVNPEKIYSSLNDPALFEILRKSDFLFVDGVGIQWALNRILGKRSEVIPGVDLVAEVLSNSGNKISIGLLGSHEDTIEQTKAIIEKTYPNVKVLFAVHGYSENQDMVIDKIQQTAPQLVFVGMGSPKQEKWIWEHYKKFPSTVFTGVGGTFDVISGKVKRAPQLVRKFKLEWLFRFLTQPMKRWKRIMTLALFFQSV